MKCEEQILKVAPRSDYSGRVAVAVAVAVEIGTWYVCVCVCVCELEHCIHIKAH